MKKLYLIFNFLSKIVNILNTLILVKKMIAVKKEIYLDNLEKLELTFSNLPFKKDRNWRFKLLPMKIKFKFLS